VTSRGAAGFGRRGLVLALLAGGLCSLALPSAALAAPVGIGIFDEASSASFKVINYHAAPGHDNNVTVELDGTDYIVTDSGVGSITDADGIGGCEQTVMMNVFRCPDPNVKPACWDPFNPEFPPDARIVRRVQVQGNDGDDTVTMENPDPNDPANPSVTADLVVLGNAGNDRVNGHQCASLLVGGEGNDVLYGGDNSDLIFGQNGDDEIHPGLGDDYDPYGRIGATGGLGSDTLSYSERTGAGEFVNIDMSDTIKTMGTTEGPCKIGRGGPGFKEFDTVNVTPTEQFEVVIGSSGDDCIHGTRWAQALRGGPGQDQISGGQGIDSADYSDKTAAVTVSIGDDATNAPGNDGVGRGVAGDTEGDNVYSDVEEIVGGAGNDTLIGQDRTTANYDPAGGYNSRSGQEGANTLTGGPGNDLLDGKQDADTFTGGEGIDTVTYAGRTSAVVGTVGDENNDDGDATDVNSLTSRGDNIDGTVEQVIGGPGNDVLRGNGLDNLLEGAGGNDRISGGSGNDDLRGGEGDDLLDGAAGNDTLSGQGGNDPGLEGGSGDDVLDGGDGNDLLDGNTGADSIIGGTGGDVADYSERLGPVTASADGVGGDGEAGEGDSIAGDVEDLKGGTDDDVLVGNGDAGTLEGGGGDDLLDGGAGGDNLFGGAGADRVTYAGRGAPVTVDLTNFGGDGGAGEDDDIADDVEKVSGGAGNDTFIGDGASSIFSGGEGVDTIDGGGGFDLLHGDGGNDSLNGGGGTDQVFGDGGNDALLGGTENDTLSGGVGDDSLDGGTGADILNGNEGADTANYAARTAAVSIALDGAPNDGQSNEKDLVKADVESVSSGSGNDTINSADGLAGKVSCGRGTDTVSNRDASDTIADDCEKVGASSNRCSFRAASGGRMSRSGVVRIRVTCPAAGRGSLTLRRGRAKVGRKSFSVRAGKVKTVKVKLSRKGRRAVTRARRNRLSVKVTLSKIRAGKRTAARGGTQSITIKAPRGK
jgi:Ca2+-binding RTX toxin-like protein